MVPNAPFKSPQKVINILSEITAKGGCLLLGVGPTADGVIEEEVTKRLHEVGKWLRFNGKAIYNTRITPVYRMVMYGLLLIRMERPYMLFMRCPKARSCRRSLNGRAICPKGT